ncbi:triose-phosphate isomerase [Aliidiomarina haloalkalitolerans]|uniref:Triosephosphate isomerase n=1 Tax=Aliidiomarina haloalkalitolerans TaxID=859059 RepID=A0A432VZD9_9GAMM|nr:triose-phosphate isomerase [Aliidiomarina haloalkalitolerans]RUO22017.1 triose-phosphate isomerase [Aliidiomarina haloalkalitolerans]
MRTSLVIANWKLNGDAELLKSFAEHFHQSEIQQHIGVAICPPAVYLKTADVLLNAIGVKVGGQNCSEFEQGAYTGEISAQMLADSGCRYVLIGHSERRALFAESDAVMAGKVQQAQAAGLTPVLCIGETLEQREAGELEQVIEQQLSSACKEVDFENLVIAYEPVWAIGTGKTATPAQAQDVHRLIRNWVATKAPEAAQKIQILYGGSVKADNATELFSQADIDGGLIGGASLDTEQFAAICQAANVKKDS